MNMIRPSVRSASRWLFTLLVLGFVGSLWAPTADAADNTVVTSAPANGGTVDTPPTGLSVTFSQPLGTNNTLALTCGPDNIVVPMGTVVVLADQVTLSAPLVAVAPKGGCTIAWRVTDINLQPAGSGNISFTIANDPAPASTTTSTLPPAPGETFLPITTDAAVPATDGGANVGAGTAVGASGTDAANDTSSSKGPLGLFRLFSSLGLAVLFGSLVLIAVAWPEGVEYILTVRFLRTAWIFALVSAYLYACGLAASQSGAGIGSTLSPTGWGNLMDSSPGKAAVLRLVFVAVSAFAVMRPDRIIDPSTQLPALLPPGIAVVTLAFSRSEFGLLENATGAVHALAMAVWLGGLVLLTRVVLAGPGEEDLVHAVRGFARLATPAIWVTVITGAIQMFQLDRGQLGSSHGLVLIVKVLFVSVMVFVGVAARQFISQRVSRVDTMTAPLANRLRRALGIEALVGLVVLTLTAWLLALTPVGLDAGGSARSLQLGVTHSFQNPSTGVAVDVAFSERVGNNDVLITVVTPAIGLTGLTVDFYPPPGATVSALTINQIPLTGAGSAQLEKSDGFSLAATGNWTLVVSAGGVEVAREVVLVGGGAAGTDTLAP